LVARVIVAVTEACFDSANVNLAALYDTGAFGVRTGRLVNARAVPLPPVPGGGVPVGVVVVPVGGGVPPPDGGGVPPPPDGGVVIVQANVVAGL
jgi:hypothetical protein